MKLPRVNDNVAFSASFLKSTQAHELGVLRGVVLSVYSVGHNVVAKVVWNDGETRSVLGSNLRTVNTMHKELF